MGRTFVDGVCIEMYDDKLANEVQCVLVEHEVDLEVTRHCRGHEVLHFLRFTWMDFPTIKSQNALLRILNRTRKVLYQMYSLKKLSFSKIVIALNLSKCVEKFVDLDELLKDD